MKIIANRNDSLYNDRFGANLKEVAEGRNLDIAVAFFTNYKLIKDLLDSGSNIRMIVRLNVGTSPSALRKIFGERNIQIRYFTSERFHPKLYIVCHNSAFVGSSNLTESALSVNNELNICFDYDEDAAIFSELTSIFEEYWVQAQVLDQEALKIFEESDDKYSKTRCLPEIKKKYGETYAQNTIDFREIDKRKSYIESFKRDYQSYISAFKKLREFYESTSERKWSDVPLHIEIDRFLWWIREYKCSGPDGWRRDRSLKDGEIAKNVLELKAEYLMFWDDYLEKIAHNYEYVVDGLSSATKIKSMDEDSLFKVLNNVHAFHDLLRFHIGGTDGLKRDFFAANKMDQIKKTLVHLIYGIGSYEERIYDCIYSSEYKLQGFGESCVKELYGYMNQEDIPICNGRTLKSLEWLGFGKL